MAALSPESRRVAGVLLVVLPTVMIGGVSLLALMIFSAWVKLVMVAYRAMGYLLTSDVLSSLREIPLSFI